MIDPPVTPVTAETAAPAKRPAADPSIPAERFSFYFSASHRASYHPQRSISLFNGKEFTECCRVGVQPAKRADLVTVGTGTMSEVTHTKP